MRQQVNICRNARFLILLLCGLSIAFTCAVNELYPVKARFHTVLPSTRVDDQSDLSTLEIFLKLVKGKLQVNRTTSKLHMSDRFKNRLSPHLSEAAVTKSLFDELDQALGKLQKIYHYRLPDALRQQVEQDDSFRATFESDQETKELSDFTNDDWSAFTDAFKQWYDTKTKGMEPHPLPAVINDALKTLAPHLNHTPMTFDVSMDAPTDIDETGTMTVHVADPIGDLTEDDYLITVPSEAAKFAHKDKIAPTVEEIRNALKPLKGELWRSQRIRLYLAHYFEDSDYQRAFEPLSDLAPGLHVSEANDSPKEIRIGRVRRIARIDMLNFSDTDPLIDLVLRQLLNDSTFSAYVRKQKGKDSSARPVHTATAENLINFAYIYLDSLTGKINEPHFSTARFDAQTTSLDKLGYSLAVMPYDPQTDTLPGGGPAQDDETQQDLYLRLLVSKKTDEAAKQKDKPDPTPTPTTSPLPASSPVSSASPLQTASPSVTTKPSPTPQAGKVLEKKNYLGVELIYKPDQGVKFNGLYKRRGLLNTEKGSGDLSLAIGNANEHFIVTGDFSGSNLFFAKLHRSLAIDLSGSSDFEVQRIFSGVKTNERRQFSSARADLDLWTRPNQLSIFVEANGGTVELLQNDLSISKQHLNTLSFGGVVVIKTGEVIPRRSLQLEPKLHFGLGLAANEPTFNVLSLRAVFQQHRDIPARFGFEVTGRLDRASRNTPIFEQPSFGGVDSVRGFRADDAIGRKLWSLQNEVRGPIFGLAPDVEGWKQFLRTQIKLALFLDVGGVTDTAGSKAGVRAGPGAGLRINFQGVNMKFDYAYGIGDGAFGRGHGRFHFGIQAPLPF